MTAPSDGSVETPRAAGRSRAAGASALWRDMAGGTAADPGFVWALVVGVLLVCLGLLGFVPNPIVGSPSPAWGVPLLLTGDAHDVLHLVAGAVALHAALGMSRAHRDGVLIGLGAAALILLALGLLDGRWFGIAPFHVELADQLLHLIVGVGSLVMGLAGTGAITVPVVTGAYRRSELGLTGASAAAVTVGPVSPSAPGTDAMPQSDAAGDPSLDAPAEPEPVEAMPEPLGLELDEPEPAPGSAPGEQPDAALVGEPEPAAVAEPLVVAEREPPVDPEPPIGTATEPEPDPLADTAAEPEPDPLADTAAEPEADPLADTAAESDPRPPAEPSREPDTH